MKETEGFIARALEQENAKEILIKKLEDNSIEIFTDGKSNGKGRYYSPRIKGYEHYKDYSRHPIQMSSQNIIVIHHFKDDGGLDQKFEYHDMTEENNAVFEDSYMMYKTSAEQFFNQLEGGYCDAFLEAIIIEATKKLINSDTRRKSLNIPNCPYESRAEKALERAKKEIE